MTIQSYTLSIFLVLIDFQPIDLSTCWFPSPSILVGLPAVGLIATYPLAKRWMPIPQIYLGLTFNWGIFIGYATVWSDPLFRDDF